jgi:hypothetical protein
MEVSMEVVEVYEIEHILSDYAIARSHSDIKTIEKKHMLQKAMNELLDKGFSERQFLLRPIWSERPYKKPDDSLYAQVYEAKTIIRLDIVVYKELGSHEDY